MNMHNKVQVDFNSMYYLNFIENKIGSGYLIQVAFCSLWALNLQNFMKCRRQK